MVRFENSWETDAEGNNLPYLDEIISKLKKENSVRLTALYTEGWNIVNIEGPFFYLYLHEVAQTSAAAKVLQGYQPGWAGVLAYRGGGFRTASLAT
jgi:hypothetical protein